MELLGIIFSLLIIVNAQDIGFKDCGKKVGCVKAGSNCTSFQSCDAVSLFYLNRTTNLVHVKLYFTWKWGAFAENTLQKPTGKSRMDGLKGFYCTTSSGTNPTITIRFIHGIGFKKPENVGPESIPEVNNVQTSSINGVHMCSFTRPWTMTSNQGKKHLFDCDLENLVRILVFSQKQDKNGDIMYHGASNYFIETKNNISDWSQITLPRDRNGTNDRNGTRNDKGSANILFATSTNLLLMALFVILLFL